MDITGKKILVVDDSVMARKQLIDAIKECGDGAEFIQASNGAEALELYKEHKPDIAFLDIVMPVMDGTEALARITDYDSSAVIIMVSSIGTNDQLKRAIRFGAKDFIQKPFEKNQIVDIISNRL